MFEIEAGSYNEFQHNQIKPKDRFSLNFSTEMILNLNKYVLKLSSSINKIDGVFELISKNVQNDSLVYLNDLNCFKVRFEKIILNILSLMECIGGEKFLDQKILDFYALINEYRSKDLRYDFFDSLNTLMDNSEAFCKKLHGQEIAMKTINLELFHNPALILKKFLFEKYVYAKRQADENKKGSKPNSPSSPPGTPSTRNNDAKEKLFFLEVYLFFRENSLTMAFKKKYTIKSPILFNLLIEHFLRLPSLKLN